MIKKFLNSSIVYAGSALLFSVGRQIVFFPILNSISTELFVKISFLIILIDFLVYSFGASIADYYVKSVTSSNDKQYKLYKFLFYLSLSSLSSLLIFYYYNMSFVTSILLSIYILVYVLNTLQIKIFFNNLKFSKNYIYVLLRLLPYFLLIVYTYTIGIHSFLIFILLLLIFEIISFYTFKLQLIAVYEHIKKIKIKKDNKVFEFILIYLLFALVFRLDMFIVEYKFNDMFSQYYQMISVYMIFVNPIILLSSASLLSILTHVDINKFVENKNKILLSVFLVAIFSGILFQLFGEYIVQFLYPKNNLIVKYDFLSFVIIFTTLIFQILKTFVIKYTNQKDILISNILVLLFPILFIDNFINFIVSFFVFRSLLFFLNYLRIKNNVQ